MTNLQGPHTHVPHYKLSFGSRAFRVSAPQEYNSVPLHICQAQTLTAFRRHLKTYYFQSAYLAPQRSPPMRSASLLRFWCYINWYLLTYLLILA